MNSETLKPCPFCGAQPTAITEENTACWYVECDCEAQGPHENTGTTAIAAWNTRTAMQADAAPVAMVRVTNGGYVMSLARYVAYSLPEGDHWLYTHPPVADRVSTSSPVDDRGSGNMSGKLRDAVEVWKDAYEAWCNPPPHLAFSESAAAAIEADREAVRAEQAAELAKFKALAETLAGALEPVERLEMWSSSAKDSDMVVTSMGTVRKMREAYRQYKEARDAS